MLDNANSFPKGVDVEKMERVEQVKKLSEALGNVTIVSKGAQDIISNGKDGKDAYNAQKIETSPMFLISIVQLCFATTQVAHGVVEDKVIYSLVR